MVEVTTVGGAGGRLFIADRFEVGRRTLAWPTVASCDTLVAAAANLATTVVSR